MDSTILIITFIVILLDSIGINVPSPALLFKTIIESFCDVKGDKRMKMSIFKTNITLILLFVLEECC